LRKTSGEEVKIFRQWGRNARVLVATEPFWSIPMSWSFFYRPIFLRESATLSEVQIGLLFTVLSFFSFLGPLGGGYLADRFGRKRVFMIFDSFGWLPSLAVWIVTRNIWYALAAYIIEGMTTVGYSAWECLLVEDTDPKYRASIYGYINAIFNGGALSTPLAGYLIGLYGVDLGSRMLFTTAFVSMVPMCTIRQIYIRESELGTEIMRRKSFEGLKGYLASLSMIRRSRVLVALLLISVIGGWGGFYHVVSGFLLPLYLIEGRGLGLSEDVASLIPAASSISSLVIALLVVSKLTSRSGYVKALGSGYGIGCVAILLLICSPRGYLFSALVAGVLLGIINGTVFSVSRTFLTNEIEAIDSRGRAKIISIALTLSSLFNLPSPVLAGYLFSLEPKLPFIAVSAALIISLAMLFLAIKTE